MKEETYEKTTRFNMSQDLFHGLEEQAHFSERRRSVRVESSPALQLSDLHPPIPGFPPSERYSRAF